MNSALQRWSEEGDRTGRGRYVRRSGTSQPLGLIGIIVCTLIVFQYQNARYFGPIELAATSGGVLLSILLWIRYSRQRSFDFLDPIHLVMGILLFGFCGVLIFDPSVHLTRYAEPERALIVSVVAALAFALGYTAFTGASSPRILPPRLSMLGIMRRVPRPEAPALLLGLWLLTFFFRLFYSFEHGYKGAFSNPNPADANVADLVGSFGKLGAYFIFSALVIWLSRSRQFGRLEIWLALTCLGLEVWINIVAGWKYSPVLFVVGLLFVARARASWGKPPGLGTGLVAVACLAAFLVVFHALDTLRSRNVQSGFDIEALAATIGQTDADSIQQSRERFVQRVGYGGFLADVIGVVDAGVLDRQHGATLWPGLLWFIPRSVWPAKPTLSIGRWYAAGVLGWGPGMSEAAVTVPGDLYLNFDVEGVFVGMLGYGVVLRLLYDRFVVSGRTVIGLCLFVPIFMTFALTLERNLSAIVGEAGLLVVALAAVLFCVTSRPPAESPAGPYLNSRSFRHRSSCSPI
jgi:hypothetical protein